MTTRIVICIDLDTNDIQDAYGQVNNTMGRTGLDWESSDEWFYDDGVEIPEFIISEARMRFLDAQKEPTRTPIDYICEECGSDEITVEPLGVQFDPYRQDWEITDICDKGHYCPKCDGTCHLKEIEFFGKLDPAIAGKYAPPRGT